MYTFQQRLKFPFTINNISIITTMPVEQNDKTLTLKLGNVRRGFLAD
jgi:hypothetical protein